MELIKQHMTNIPLMVLLAYPWIITELIETCMWISGKFDRTGITKPSVENSFSFLT